MIKIPFIRLGDCWLCCITLSLALDPDNFVPMYPNSLSMRMMSKAIMLNDTNKTNGEQWADLDTAMIIRANNNDRNHKYNVGFVHDSRKCEYREHTNLHDCFYGAIQVDLCLFILSLGEVSWEKIPVPKLWVELRLELQETFLVPALVCSMTRTVAVDILQLTCGLLDALLSSLLDALLSSLLNALLSST